MNITDSKYYYTWKRMLNRCYVPKTKGYSDYGGRGISVCDEWLNPETFITWASKYGEGLSIERLDYNGNYSPDNCKMVPFYKQNRNKRNTRYVIFRGRKVKERTIGRVLNTGKEFREFVVRNGIDKAVEFYLIKGGTLNVDRRTTSEIISNN